MRSHYFYPPMLDKKQYQVSYFVCWRYTSLFLNLYFNIEYTTFIEKMKKLFKSEIKITILVVANNSKCSNVKTSFTSYTYLPHLTGS